MRTDTVRIIAKMTGMDTAERLLKLLGLLEGRIDWTADDLARRLEVTTRTVRRDITRLRDLGYPVEAVAGPGGGYRLGAGGKLPPLLLDDEEALAVALGLRVATATAVGGLEDASLSALSKLEHVLPPRLRTQLEDISEATVSTVWTSASSADHGTLALAASAARSRERTPLRLHRQRRQALRQRTSSRSNWSTPAVAGTWWPSTWTVTTGAPSGWIGLSDPKGDRDALGPASRARSR